MTSPSSSARPRPEWQASLARVTLFLAPGQQSNLTWKALTGLDAAATNVSGGDKTETGPFSNGQLILQNRQNRTDTILLPALETSGVNIPTLGPFPSSTAAFFNSVQKWAPMFPPVQRIAVGVQLFQVATDLADASKRLLKVLPTIDIELEKIRDFLLQLNIPLQSAVRQNLTLNRLTKLSIHQIQSAIITSGGIQAGPTVFLPAMELDLSTAADNTVAIQNELPQLLVELVDKATEIAQTGPLG